MFVPVIKLLVDVILHVKKYSDASIPQSNATASQLSLVIFQPKFCMYILFVLSSLSFFSLAAYRTKINCINFESIQATGPYGQWLKKQQLNVIVKYSIR